ncbi:MAG: hypothetical protein KKE17_14865 [Proteobacteria bacterium]|nr:hypothetical protein [Pseudomonadota bacterium]
MKNFLNSLCGNTKMQCLPGKTLLSIPYFFLAALFILGAFFFLTWPITGLGDTDLWYHLNGGRYLFRHGEIANTGFFSFVAEQREWTNYYWLFQVIVYSIHSLFDYQGLILFRSFIYLTTLLMITRYLCKDTKNNNLLLYVSLIAALYFIGLIPRYFSVVRPHMFSYLFIVLFIYLLELKSSKALLALPFIAVFWSNIHGVEYPVMILISMSYVIEILYNRYKQKASLSSKELRILIPLLLAMWAVLATPFGVKLLSSPFLSAGYQKLYIMDMHPIAFKDLFSFNVSSSSHTFNTISNTLLFIATLGFISGALNKKLRISHILLFAGGLYLLTRGVRFRYEAVLLALPILKNHPILSENYFQKKIPVFFHLVIMTMTIFLSIFFLKSIFIQKPKYPFSRANVPHGVAAFLNTVETGGSVLNHPDYGGYLQWQLDDRYTIFMDFQLMLFSDMDFFIAENSFTDQEVLKKTIDQYHPSFIAPNISDSKFNELIKKFPDYILVYFDDKCALYVDRGQHPEIAEHHAMKAVNPFTLEHSNIAQLLPQQAEQMQQELLKIYPFYQEGQLINQLLTQLYRKAGILDKALEHAEKIITNMPESPTGYILTAEMLTEKKQYLKAIQLYNKALDNVGANGKIDIFRKISLCYYSLEKLDLAYQAFKKTIRFFSADTSATDFYMLGKLAVANGNYQEGAMLLDFALLKTPPDKKDLIRKIQNQFILVQQKQL